MYRQKHAENRNKIGNVLPKLILNIDHHLLVDIQSRWINQLKIFIIICLHTAQVVSYYSSNINMTQPVWNYESSVIKLNQWSIYSRLYCRIILVNHSCEKSQMLKKYNFICFLVQRGNSVPENATNTSISPRDYIRKFTL